MEPHKDIAKMGPLKRLKTMKRKWFVLWNEGVTGPARLEYYDTEKKFRNSVPAKRGININHCFNINKKSDTKHKFSIALYTKEDCFAVVCDNEQEQQAWLSAMLQLLSYNTDGNESSRPLFEHIWQVTVKQKGLASSWNIGHGCYRLCLTNSALSLIRLHEEEPAVTFQLASIRRCGHSDCFFFMEVGRWAMTGPGELWMQVEDTVIAQNMHDVILSSMRASNATTENQLPVFRNRSRSSASENTRPGPSSRGTLGGYESATLPKRSKTISEPHGQSPMRNRKLTQNRMNRHTTSGMLPRHSPSTASPLSQSLMEQGDVDPRDRTDSMESRGSYGTASSGISVDEIDEQLIHSGSASTRSVTPEGPFRESDYLPMSPISKDSSTSPGTDIPVSGYMEMSPGVTPETSSDNTGYMDMSPGQLDTRNSFTASPAPSTGSSISNHDCDDKAGYLDMTPIARSLPTVEEKSPWDYMAVSPGNQSPRNPNYLRPDKVCSFLLSEENQANEGLPKRAYSVGSKPAAVVRIKAKVVGENSGAPIETSSSKSLSAPHLPDKDKLDKSQKVKKEGNGHFMEMDFFRQRTDSTSSFRSRTSSGGKDIKDLKDVRSRTSSLGQQDFRPRTSSAGNLNRPANNSFKLEKPWLSKDKSNQLTQDSIRPRTSSCGQDYRPRAASLGNSKHRKPGKSGSQESLTKVLFNSIRRKSQELSKGHSKSGYMDMTSPGSRPSYTEESSYIDMAPQTIEETSPNKDKGFSEIHLGVPDLTSTPKGKAVDPYMEMHMGQKEGAHYANIKYHTESNRSKNLATNNSLVEEEEMEITPPDHEVKETKIVDKINMSEVCNQPTGGYNSKSDNDGYLSIDFSGAQKSTITGKSTVQNVKTSSPSPKPQKMECFFSDPDEKKTKNSESDKVSPKGATQKEHYVSIPAKNTSLPVPFQTGTTVIKPMTVKTPSPIQTFKKCPPKPMDTEGYMSMAFDEKTEVSKESKNTGKPISPINMHSVPLVADSLGKRHGGRTSPQPAAAKNAKKSSGVQKVRRSSSNKEPTQIKPAGNRLVITSQEKEPSVRKISASSLPGSVEGSRRTSSSGSDPDSTGVKRQSLQENTVFSDTGSSMSRNSSKTSLVGDKEVVYAALDLSDPTDDSALGSNPPQKSASRTSLSGMAEDSDAPLSYAQIDFTKSGGLRHSASAKELPR